MGAERDRRVWPFNNRNAQKCAIAHLIRHSGLPELAIERRWGVRSCSAADSSRLVCEVVRAHRGAMAAVLVEQRQPLWRSRSIHGVESTRARMPCAPAVPSRAPRSAASACRHLQRVVVHGRGLSRCPRTVLKAQLLIFATCTGEANALRKSRLRDELLLVKAQLRFFRRSPARRPR